MRRKNKEVVFVEVDPARKARLKLAKDVLKKDSMSALAIEAIDEKLDRAARKHPDLHRERFPSEVEPAAA